MNDTSIPPTMRSFYNIITVYQVYFLKDFTHNYNGWFYFIWTYIFFLSGKTFGSLVLLLRLKENSVFYDSNTSKSLV